MPAFERILVVCVGNICRSPTAEFMLRQALPDLQISSAGLGALSGHDMEATARRVAEARGLVCPKHEARQLTPNLCREADLILVMEARHRDGVAQLSPESRGKIFLLAQGLPQADIPDPYRKPQAVFERVYDHIDTACQRWVSRLVPR